MEEIVQSGCTILLVSHNLEEVQSIAPSIHMDRCRKAENGRSDKRCHPSLQKG